jgi:hypothetical protein
MSATLKRIDKLGYIERQARWSLQPTRTLLLTE